MTTERRKAILFLSLTLIVGVAIGAMTPVFLAHIRSDQFTENRNSTQGDRDGRERDDNSRGNNRDGGRGSFGRGPTDDRFVNLLFRYINPDSTQQGQIETIGRETSATIDSIQESYNSSVNTILDSMRTRLQPILSEEQSEDLDRMIRRQQ